LLSLRIQIIHKILHHDNKNYNNNPKTVKQNLSMINSIQRIIWNMNLHSLTAKPKDLRTKQKKKIILKNQCHQTYDIITLTWL